MAVLGRRCGQFFEILPTFQAKVITTKKELVEEVFWHGLPIVVPTWDYRYAASGGECASFSLYSFLIDL